MYEVNASAAPVFAASKTLTFTAIIQQFADLVVILWAVLPKQTKIFSGSKSWRGGFTHALGREHFLKVKGELGFNTTCFLASHDKNYLHIKIFAVRISTKHIK